MRRDPWWVFDEDSIFDRVFDKTLSQVYSPLYAGEDVEQTTEGVYYYVSVPGVKRDELSVSVENDELLVVKCERKEKTKNKHFATSFRKTYSVYGCDVAKITAKLEDGVLTIFIPHLTTEKPSSTPITIQ